MTFSNAIASKEFRIGNWTRPFIILVSLSCFLAFGPKANAQIITSNGGFELGLTGWTVLDQLGSDGSFFLQMGATSPINGTMVPSPPGGLRAAMTDAQGPGTHVLYQDVTVPTLPFASAQLRFDIFVGNRAAAFFTPSPALLDFSTPTLNQQARVDLLNGSADPFSAMTGDILFNAFQTMPGDPLVSGYTTVMADVTALLSANLGNTLRLRFAEVDNVFSFQFGVDNVSLTLTPVPEPSSLVLMALGVITGGRFAFLRRRRNPNESIE